MPRASKTFRSREKEKPAPKKSKRERGYGGEWEYISLMKRAQNPVCEVCRDQPATQVDHIQAFDGLDDPLRTEWTNLQSICQQCHSWKTNVAKNQLAAVTVVCGEPGSGKSTFCDRHKPVTALLFDLDRIAQVLQPEWARNERRPVEANALIADWRELLIDRIAGGRFQTEAWIIQADVEKAAQTAMKLSGRLVRCVKQGCVYKAEVIQPETLREGACVSL